MSYDKEYHDNVHKLFLDDGYYQRKAKWAMNNYFNGENLDSSILEFGCGLGQNIFMLPEAIGYDISSYALAYCRSKGIKVIETLDEVLDSSLDIVLCSHVLEHVEEPFSTLHIIKDKLTKQGKLILVLPVESQYTISNYEMDIDQHLYSWNQNTIKNLLIKAGYDIESIKEKNVAYGSLKLKRLLYINSGLHNVLTRLIGWVYDRNELIIKAVKKGE